MDSQRLIINNYDLSTSSLPTTTTIKGYTVVKAPKGPITPVLLSANESTGATKQMKEIFGDWSASYPELYEVAQYLSGGYDVFVSAPYMEATIPVAYLTAKGVLPTANTVTYNASVEALVNGTIDPEEIDIDGITDFATNVDVSYDVNYGNTLFGASGPDLGSDVYPGYSNSNLVISTNATIDNVSSLRSGGETRIYILLKNVLGEDYRFTIALDAQTSQYLVKDGDTVSASTVGACYNVSTGAVLSTTTDIFEIRLTNNAFPEGVLQSLADISNRKGINSYWVAPIASDDIKAVLFPKYPSERKTFINFSSFDPVNGRPSTSASVRNNLSFTAYDEGAGAYGNTGVLGTATYNLATKISNEEYANQNMICVYAKNSFKSTEVLSNIGAYPPVVLQGGTRKFEKYNACSSSEIADASITYYTLDGSGNYIVANPQPVGALSDSYYTKTNDYDLHNLGWEAALGDEYSDVDIFFDSARHNYDGTTMTAADNEFFSIANTHELSGYIFNYTIAPNQISGFTGKLSYGYNYWNICNEAKIIGADNHGTIWSPMTGVRALMQSRIIENRWGGVAPMYLNSAGMGGQLQGMEGLQTLRYTYKKDAQMALDNINFNPVIRDSAYGVMVVGQKTCKADDITDYSYIGHVSAFLNFEKEVKVNVMIPQLGKANNDYYRELRAQQVEALLAKRLQGSTRIWAAAQVDTSTADGCNDVAAQKARKFVINVKVKVDIFSEFVELNFINVDQATAL